MSTLSRELRAEEKKDLYTGEVLAGLHFDSEGFEFSLGLRGSWTRLDTLMPFGLDLEFSRLFRAEAFRFAPSFHTFAAKPLKGSDCEKAGMVRTRGNEGAEGPSLSLGVGPVFDVGDDFDWGPSASAHLGFAFVGALAARGTWFWETGPEASVAAGLRLPSILGRTDIAIFCD